MASGSRDIKIRFTSDTEGLDQASSDAQSSFKGVSRSSEKMSKAMGRTGDASKKTTGQLDRVGKAGDKVDTTARGLRHGFMGAQDTMLGVSKVAEGDLVPGLIGLGSGISDLGASVYNGIIPTLSGLGGKLKGVGTRMANLRESAPKTGKSLKNFAKGAGIVAGIAAITVAFKKLDDVLADDLDADTSKLNDALDVFVKTGEPTGELTRVLGDDFEDLGRALDNTGSFGDDFVKNVFESWVPGLDGLDNSVTKNEDRLDALDKTLANLAEDSPQRAAKALKLVAKRAGLSKDQINDLKDRLPEYKRQRETTTAKDEEAAEALERQVQAMKEATDPVFQLTSALDKVDDAQDSYNKAVDKYGESSEEARSASLDVAKAVSGAEAAAKNGDLSFREFKGQLSEWVDQGAITEGEAANIRDRVYEARRESNKYSGSENLTLTATDKATPVIQGLGTNLDSVYNKLLDINNTDVAPGGGELPLGDITGGGGHRASGGPVSRGTSYIVGEQGPELFTPGASGDITPNDKLGNGGGSAPGGASPEALREALSGMELRVDGRGMANLVNRSNKKQERRRAAN